MTRTDIPILPAAAPHYQAIKDAAAVNNNDGPRTLAFAAVRDGENWNDRRLPEMGRALDAALDAIDKLAADLGGAPDARAIIAATLAAIERNPETDVIYVHPEGDSPIVAVIVPIASWPKVLDGVYSHGHIAGDEDDE